MLEVLAALLLTAGAAGVGALLWRSTVDVDAANRALFRGEALAAEAARLQRMGEQLSDAQRLSEAAVSGGTDLVRTLHKGIAAVPFGILEAIPATRQTTRIVRETHDLISDTVYGTIGAVNRGIGGLLRAGMNARKAAAPGSLQARSAALESAGSSPRQEDPPPEA